MLKIGLVGCGAIGSELARAITNDFGQVAKLVYLCDKDPQAIQSLKTKLKISPARVSIPELIKKSDFIIEAASQQAVLEMVPLALRFGKKLMVLSVGGLSHFPKKLLFRSKGTLYVPSGAVVGVDALQAASLGKIKRVTITTYKPLESLKGAPFFKRWGWKNIIRKPTVVFSGTAKSAVSLFPQNINVAATLSLAGIGFNRTQVRIVTSPEFKRNTHEIVFEGDFGRVRCVAENVPSKANPKTSALTVYSTIACLKKIFSSFKIGT